MTRIARSRLRVQFVIIDITIIERLFRCLKGGHHPLKNDLPTAEDFATVAELQQEGRSL